MTRRNDTTPVIEDFKKLCSKDPVLDKYLEDMKYYSGSGEWQLVGYERELQYQENYINGAWRLFLQVEL